MQRKPKGIDPEVVDIRERIAKLETILYDLIKPALVEQAKRDADYLARIGVLENTRLVEVAPPMWANAPLHVTEDEEDAKWQLDNGMIDKKMYEEILEEAGLTPHLEIVNY